MLPRAQKQFLIGGIYVLIAAAIGGSIYWSKYQPTCSDAIKNGKEEGVDCGTLACGKACEAPVQALQVSYVQIAKTPAGDHDVAFELYNPNVNYGVSMGTYELTVGDQVSAHDFYMLNGQTKNVVLTSLKGLPDNIPPQVTVKSVQWEKVSAGRDAEVLLTTSNEGYSVSGGQTTFEAVITNNSNFDLDTIDVGAIVVDTSGTMLATNMTVIRTLLSRGSRHIKLSWPFALPADAHVHTEIWTNVFDNSNFLKTNGTQEKFQQYY